MRRRKISAAAILTDAEVAALGALLRASLGPEVVRIADRVGVDPEKLLRFRPLSVRCAAAREQLGLSIREAARRLKAPQFRLKDIEQGRFFAVQPEVLRRYVGLLQLEAWFRRWRAANRALAAELGLD